MKFANIFVQHYDEIVSQEKRRLHELFDNQDAGIAERINKMRQLIGALNALKTEIGNVKGVEIKSAPNGAYASVEINTSIRKSYSISTNIGNTCFVVEEHSYDIFGDFESKDQTHEFSNSDLVLQLVVNAIGNHVAQQQVFTERNKRDPTTGSPGHH